jgi:hypothetical protein
MRALFKTARPMNGFCGGVKDNEKSDRLQTQAVVVRSGELDKIA